MLNYDMLYRFGQYPVQHIKHKFPAPPEMRNDTSFMFSKLYIYVT